MNKGDRIIFKYGGSKYIGEAKRAIMIDKGSMIDIPYYTFLDSIFNLGAEITCICTRCDKKGISYDLDMEFIYSQIYEEDIVYSFKAVELVKDKTTFRRYLLLEDEYGIEHKLFHPHPNDIKKVGDTVDCLVVSISGEGLLLKSLETEIEDIPDDKSQQELFDKLHDSRVEDYKVFSKKDFKGVLDDTVNKYPDTAHFIFELLQNADDAKASEVSFILTEDRLIFKHNGSIHFNVSDVDDDESTGHINSITAIGNSSKDDLTENKIGKFGVGFKSVFKYTDAPEIYDDVFKFKIEKFIIPTRIDSDYDGMREKGETLFVFPFIDEEEAYSDIHEKLDELGNATLFLHHLKKISWADVTTSEEGEFSKSVQESKQFGDILCEKLLLDNTTSMWMLTREVNIPGHGKHPINLGYYLDEEGRINTQGKPRVHCFFPTEETFERCFVCHAPFVLVSSRQNLKPKDPANNLLVNELVKLAADSLPILRDLGLLDSNLFQIVGEEDSFHYYYRTDRLIRPSVIYNACIEKIKHERLLLSDKGIFKNGNELFIAQPTNIKEVVNVDMLRGLYRESNVDYMDDDLGDKFSDWDKIGVRFFSSATLGQRITQEFMRSQDPSWVNRLFGFIVDDARSLWNKNTKDAVFRSAPIIKTSKGLWVAPFAGDDLNVYYDGAGSEQYNVVDKNFSELKNVKKFLDDIGCKEPDQLDYIKTSILSKYTTGSSIKFTVLDEDMLALIRHSRKISLEERPAFIQLVASKILLAFKNEYDQIELKRPKEMFVDSEMILEFLTNHSTLSHIESSVYKTTIKEFGKQGFENFVTELGCKTRPELCEPLSYWLSDNQRAQINYAGTPHTQIHFKGKDIEGLRDCLRYNKISKRLSRQIWSWLIELDPENYKTLRVDLYYRTSHYKYCDSTIVEHLRGNAWLYNSDGNTVKPCEVTKEELLTLGYQLSNSLFSLLEIKSKNIDIEAMGGTAEDSKVYKLGKILTDHGITTAEDLDEYLAYKEEKKRKEKAEKEWKEKEKEREEQQEVLSRNEMTSQGADDFTGVDTSNADSYTQTREKSRDEKRAEHEQKVKDIKEKAENDLEKELQLDELRNSVDSLEKYGKEWFETLLKLEYGEGQKKTASNNGKTISISFGSVVKEKGSERIYVLKSPSKCPIPIEIEELGGIEVQFSFRKREGFTKGFEVASVKDFTLRLKAKQGDIDFLDEVDWSDCTKAEINANNPAQLMGKLITAFKGLEKPDGFNFKSNLRDNISFVFGPPGTGKTTYLANKIKDIFEEEYCCKILVLCPTNKACDVLTKKLYDINVPFDEIGRFVATGDEEIENLGLVCNRDSLIYDEDQCCIISTMARLPYDGFNGPEGNWRLNEINWDYIIIDEASMIPLAQIVYAIYQFEGTPIIIAGDPMQLSPIVHEEKWKGENIYSMVKLNRFDNPTTEPIQFEITNLETQYRSIPAIGRIFSEFAYSGKLKHYREDRDQLKLELKGMELKPINLIHFRVSKYDDIFGTKKLSGSNVQIYSVLLVVEFCKFLADEYERKKRQHNLTVGIICPYVAEAQMIEKLIEQIRDIPENITISVGTINGFQGDECDVVFTVFNPPAALRSCSSQEQANKLFINDLRLINVAISRAKDYMFVFIPHKETAGWGWMKSIIRMGQIITEQRDSFTSHTSDELEKIIFGKPFYIENNSFITTHQLANVYTEAAQKYEIRIDDTSVDIQIEQN